VGESIFVVSSSASYARGDAISSFLAMALRVAGSLLGMGIALFAIPGGVAILLTIGLGFSISSLVASIYLYQRQVVSIAGHDINGKSRFFGDFLVACVAGLPAISIAHWHLAGNSDRLIAIIVAVSAFASFAGIYLGLQWLRGSNSLHSLLPAIRRDTSGGR
jgi:hypothetical protein